VIERGTLTMMPFWSDARNCGVCGRSHELPWYGSGGASGSRKQTVRLPPVPGHSHPIGRSVPPNGWKWWLAARPLLSAGSTCIGPGELVGHLSPLGSRVTFAFAIALSNKALELFTVPNLRARWHERARTAQGLRICA
jgi:hypothetical protein